MKFLPFLLIILFACQKPLSTSSNLENWEPLFNGKDLSGWDIKIRGNKLNDNYGETFRVVDGNLTVNYENYTDFAQKYGHLFYKNEYSYYKLKTRYRFIGEQAPNGEGWAFRNSGIMVHGQPAASMGLNQDFPISIEVQLLGGFDDDRKRPNCNLCTPGTNVVYEGKLDKRHCINSSSETSPPTDWVEAEVEVYGDSLIRHFVNGKQVLEYTSPQMGGGNVLDFYPSIKKDGTLLKSGTISLQSESHPVQFSTVELLNLEGCMNPKAKNYKTYYVKDDGSCKF